VGFTRCKGQLTAQHLGAISADSALTAICCCFAEPLADAVYSSKGTPSRLKGDRFSTPSKLKQKAGTEPETPGAKKLSSTEDGLLGLSPQLLSPDLMLLNQLLGETWFDRGNTRT
jgi:hypothetical protein